MHRAFRLTTQRFLPVLAFSGLAVACNTSTFGADAGADAGTDAEPPVVIPDAGPDASDADTGDAGPVLSGEGLCDFSETPPRVALVSLDERPCSESEETWPYCIADACDAADFEAACRQYCEMACERERWFCTRNHCPPPDDSDLDTYCDTQAALAECADLCGDDVSCLQAACNDKREATCEGLLCPEGEANDCEDLTCANTCESASDGQCDDGSPINSLFASCALGSDCEDCGPRVACFELGAECFASSQCCGFETGSAHCVNVGTKEEPLGRCLPDCSDDPLSCPAQFLCQSLRDGVESESACFPGCAFGGG